MGSKKRHLIFLAHIWVCMPFALFWVNAPDVRKHLTEAAILAHEKGLTIN